MKNYWNNEGEKDKAYVKAHALEQEFDNRVAEHKSGLTSLNIATSRLFGPLTNDGVNSQKAKAYEDIKQDIMNDQKISTDSKMQCYEK